MGLIPDPRALLCLNLRKEWAEDPRAIAAELERQAWCLEQARQFGWPVFHAHEARGRARCPVLRGPLHGLTPRASEPLFVVADAVFGHDAFRRALCASATRRLLVIGIGRSAIVAPHGACDVGVVVDAFVELGEEIAGLARLESAEAFAPEGAKIVALEAWRLARQSEGAK